MKIVSFGVMVLLTITLLAACIGAQEKPAPDADLLISPNIPWSPFNDKPVDHLDSKSNDSPAGVIDAARYAFSAHSGIALVDMSSGATELIGWGTDNGNSALTPIGFLFRYDGVFFTHFGVNSNGIVRLGGPTIGGSNLNSINSEGNSPKIMPYWDDLCVGDNGKVHYKKVGAGESEKLVVEWKGMKISRGGVCQGNFGGTFQMWVFGRTGVIQFVYGGGMVASAVADGGYSVGIQSGPATNFASVTTAGSSVSYSTANNTQFDAITTGTSYLFSPIMPAAPSGGNATGITQSTATVNWTDNASNETAYLVARTTDHINFYFVGNVLAANSTTFSETGLTPGTQYYYYIIALTEGAFSPELVIPVTTSPPTNISSTASGGLWSAPSTWVGGIVPNVGDSVAITGGATVTIDTDAAISKNVTVGSGAFLNFGETAAFKLTVGQNVIIEANGTFATGNGNGNQHVLTVGGNLTNNGTLDFSTNNNQAAAGIVFTGASSNTFGGTGAVTDVFTITLNKGSSAANILELNAPSFTVQGSSTEGPSSGYLYLNQGTFKISGTFTGTHRTFASAQYQISAGAGFWLNNPNYSVTPQAYQVYNLGNFRLSAGSYSVGTGGGHSFIVLPDSLTIIEGGTMTIAGAYVGNGRFNYNQTGGTLTTCTWVANPGSDGCFKTSIDGQVPASFVITGGEVVIQNPPAGTAFAYDNGRGFQNQTLTGGTLRFGNSQTTGTGTFRVRGSMPNLSIDTSAGGHSVIFSVDNNAPSQTDIRNVNIGPGGLMDTSSASSDRLVLNGDTFLNNGSWTHLSSRSVYFGNDVTRDYLYTGSGIQIGTLQTAHLACRSFILGPVVGNLRIQNIWLGGDVINSGKITIGGGSSSSIWLGSTGGFDSPPVFDLGFRGLELYYTGTRTTGYEVNPERKLSLLSIFTNGQYGVVTIEGGDLTVESLQLGNGRTDTGNNRLIHTGDLTSPGGWNAGYVNGNLVKRFTQAGSYTFHVYTLLQEWPVINLTSITTVPTDILMKAVPNQPMPGLDPARAVARHWVIEKNGEAAGTLQFGWHDNEVSGNEASYKLWRSTGGAPAVVPHSAPNTSANSIKTSGSESVMTGLWGIGEREALTSVSLSGSVLTSGGAGIRNAAVTVSGGNLPAPVTVFTGSLGTYLVNGLQPGQTYTVTASAKRFRFAQASQTVTPVDNVANVNFTANPQE